jgi:radical SAM protein (TIGR01212 family)
MSQYPWNHERRFNAYSNYMKKKHGKRVQKVSIDAGFTCPNRDGTVAFGGCTYCNNDSFNPSYCDPSKPILQQIDDGIDFLSRRYKADQYVAYFQAYSNTYGSLDKLVRLYDEALSHPKIIGLVIGTRPDCIDENKLLYFSELSKKFDITLEYGIESCSNDTLQLINRGHTFEQTKEAIELTAKYGIHTSAHLIFGLPGESREYMLSEAEIVSQLPINSIKLHQLHIVKKTVMAHQYQNEPDMFQLFELEEYLDFIVDFLERLNPSIIIQRLFGEAPPYIMAGPTWGELRNHDVLDLIEKKLEERNTFQGKLFLS